jgi:flavin reductase (DIM6/NTAB) family NADH-FMN oxidoreductase RutF
MDSRDNRYLKHSVMNGPVGLITTKRRDEANVMTVSFFSDVAHYPTTLWVSINRDTLTHALISETHLFCLVLLHQKQAQLALACGSVSGRKQDKAKLMPLVTHGDFLFVPDSLSSTACRVRHQVPVGDHTLFVADVLEGEVNSRNSTYRHLMLSDLRGVN